MTMILPRSGMTPSDIISIWEQDWGVLYAGRLKFEAPPDAPLKWLNHRNHAVPGAPAIIRLDGMGSILQAVASALRQRGGAASAAEPAPSGSGPGARGSAATLPAKQPRRPPSGSGSAPASGGGAVVVAAASGGTSSSSNPILRPTLGPAERSRLKASLNTLQNRSGKFGQGRGEPSRFGRNPPAEDSST